MAYLARKLGKDKVCVNYYRNRASAIRASIIREFWDEDGGYFRAGQGDDRLDAAANVFASLWLPTQFGIRIQSAISERMIDETGLLSCYNRPYPTSRLGWTSRWFGLDGYGTTDLYPWISALNTLALLRLVEHHPNNVNAMSHVNEAKRLFSVLTELYCQDGEIYEIYDRDLQPARYRRFGRVTYESCPGFTASAIAYLAVYDKLLALGQV